LAYESDQSGQLEVYVRPFPGVGDGQWQVSTGGGSRPLWARDGRELFYVGPDGALMGVPVDARATMWRAGTPLRIVEGRYFTGSGALLSRSYDISPDGRRFVMIKPGGGDGAIAPAQIVIVKNWFEELKRLVPSN
jgi:serine/threonine-protein kinase